MERNQLCWCGSGLKYKWCHSPIEERIKLHRLKGDIVPDIGLIKSRSQIEKIKQAAKVNTLALDKVAREIKPGMNTEEINTLAYGVITEHGGIPASLNYEGYPKSVCVSINNEICHGIPDKKRILQEGDIVNVDVATNLGGYYADASRMFLLGKVAEEAKRLVRTTKECVELGLAQAKPWGYLGDIAHAINTHATDNGYSVVVDIGGHGIGLAFHEEPFVSYVTSKGTEMLLVPGMIFTIEPMINEGCENFFVDQDNDWTVYTMDGGLSAQIEYMVLITSSGAEVLAR
jgi:methionyl aminopeptidase